MPLFVPCELLNMSHDYSESLEDQSWDNAGQDDSHSTLDCVGNKTVSILSLQCGKHISEYQSWSHDEYIYRKVRCMALQ